MPSPRTVSLLGALLGLSAIAALPGCNLIALGADAVAGSRQAAKYKLDPTRPVLVFVDDPLGVFVNPLFPRTVAANAQFHLLEHRVAERLIPQDELDTYTRGKGDAFATTPVDTVGRDLGAEQVIYVRLESLAVSTEPGETRPTLIADVRVIDALTGERLWPDTPATLNGAAPGFRLVTQLSHGSQTGNRTPSAAETYRAVSERLGRDTARLFYNAFIGNDPP